MPEYDPSIFFSPLSVRQGLAIAVTPEDGVSTEERVKRETPYLVSLMLDYIPLGMISNVLDYGCGPGRVSRELALRTRSNIWGIDISRRMRALATDHVGVENFVACSPGMMGHLPTMDAIMSIWCLQHVADIEETIGRLHNRLKPLGRMFVVNAYDRILPTEGGVWSRNDPPFDVLAALRGAFDQVAFGKKLDPDYTSPLIAEHGWWGVFERR